MESSVPYTTVIGTATRATYPAGDPERFRRLFRFCRDAARTVHETYATTLAVGSDIGGEEGLAVDHTTSATWQPDRRWRPGRRGRAAGSASTQYCGA